MAIHKKLNEARVKFHELKLEKTGYNKFAGYKYFELGDFLIPALKVFNEVGLCAVVSFDKDFATMAIVDVDVPESYIFIKSPMGSAALKGCHEVQNWGAVETYQRRYLWTAALEIVEHDALDATTGQRDKVKVSGKAPASFKPTDGALESLSADEQASIRDLAGSIVFFADDNDFDAACDLIANQNLENEQKIALWSLLPSNIRSAIKRVQESRGAKHAGAVVTP